MAFGDKLKKYRKKIIMWTIITMLVVAVGGIIVSQVADFVTRGEIEARIVGVKFGSADPGQNVLGYDYLDRSSNPNNMRTASYSTTQPNQYINNWATKQLSNGEWIFDPDGHDSGSPNMQATLNTDVAPCDAAGNDLSDWAGEETSRTFTDKDNNQWDVLLYETNFKTQITIKIYPDENILKNRFLGTDYIAAEATAEAWGEYNTPNARDCDFTGKKTDLRFVVEMSIVNFQLEDLIHATDYTFYQNAFTDARITKITTAIKDTNNWQFQTEYTKMGKGEIDLYSSAENCLRQSQTIPDASVNLIDVNDIWHDTVYFGINAEALLGSNFFVGSGAYHWAQPPVNTGEYQVTYEVTFAAITSFTKPFGGNDQTQPPDTQFHDPDVDINTGFNLGAFLRDLFTDLINNPKDLSIMQWIVLIVGSIVAIVVLVLIAPYLWRGLKWLWTKGAAARQQRRQRQ